MSNTDEDFETLKILDHFTYPELEKIIGLPAFMHSRGCYSCTPDVPTIFHHGNYWGLAGRCMSNYDVGMVKQAERALELAKLLKERESPRERASDMEADHALARLTLWVEGKSLIGYRTKREEMHDN